MKEHINEGHFFEDASSRGQATYIMGAVRSTRHRLEVTGKLEHQCWVLDYSLIDGIKCRVGEGAWEDRARGVGHLYPPHTAYWEDTTQVRPPEKCVYILFAGGEWAGLRDFINPETSYARFLDAEGLMESFLQEAASVCHQMGEKAFWAGQSILYAIVDMLHRKTQRLEGETFMIKGSVDGIHPFAEIVRGHMKNSLGKPLTLKDMARIANVSTSTLSHKYQKEIGESPRKTLVKMRINMAKGLLLKGENLKSIAEQTGFYDEFHLSKSFKRITGLSPRQFVKSQKEQLPMR